MAERDTYQLVLQLKDEISSGLKAVQSNIDKTRIAATNTKNAVNGFSKAWGQMASGLQSVVGNLFSARAAFRVLNDVIGGSIQAAIEAERAEITLSAAIRSVGMQSKISTSELTKFASELEKTTVISDEQTEAAMAMLIQIGNFTEKGVKRAIPVLADYSQAMGIDIANAAEQMVFAIEGGRNSFAKFGIELNDKMTAAQKFDAIILGLTESFKGNAQAIAESTGGQLKQLGMIMGNLKETGGLLLLEVMKPMVTVLRDIGLRALEAATGMLEYHNVLKKYNAGQTLTAKEEIVRLQGEIRWIEGERKRLEAQILSTTVGMARSGPEAIAKATAEMRFQLEQLGLDLEARKRAIETIGKMIAESAANARGAGPNVIPGAARAGGGPSGYGYSGAPSGTAGILYGGTPGMTEWLAILAGIDTRIESWKSYWVDQENKNDIFNKKYLAELEANRVAAEEQLKILKEQRKAAAQGAMKAVTYPMGWFSDALSSAFENVSSSSSLGGPFQEIVGIFMELGYTFETLISTLSELGPVIGVILALVQIVTGIQTILGPVIQSIAGPFLDFLQGIGNLIGTLLLPIFQAFEPALNAITILLNALLPLFGFLVPIFMLIGNIIKIALIPVIGIIRAVIMFINGFIRAINWLLPAAWEINEIAVPEMPTFHNGGVANEDMVALLKKGEVVINPYKNTGYVAGGGAAGPIGPSITINAPNARWIDKTLAAELVQAGLAGMRA